LALDSLERRARPSRRGTVAASSIGFPARPCRRPFQATTWC
jgi:hypothetical protein